MTGSATELPAYYDAGFFDVIIANGLIGFGLDSRSDFDLLLGGAAQVLKPGGLFILGYNDKPERLGYNIRDTANFSLFEEFVPDIPGMDTSSRRIDDGYDHTYVFMRRRSLS